MKNLINLFLILNLVPFFAQPHQEMNFKLSEQYKNDSIEIENIIEFYKYSDKHTYSIDAIRFKIKITNLGNQPIPNFENVMARSEFLKLFINSKDSHDMNIQNGIGPDKIQYIGRDESDTFETSWILGEDSGINSYENLIKVMWRYLGISSEVVIVDLVNKQVMK